MFKGLFSNIKIRVGHALSRFPETLFMAFGLGLVGIQLNHLGYGDSYDTIRDTLENIAMALVIGILLTGIAKLIYERWFTGLKARTVLMALALLMTLGFYLLIPKPLTDLFAWRFGVTLVSLMIAFSLIPFWRKESLYPLGVLKLLSDGAVTLLYSIVLFIGASAILFAMEELLGVPIDSELYADIGLIIFTWFAPTHFLGALVNDGEDLQVFEYSRVFKILIVNIIMPLLTIYTTILYLYFIRLPLIGGIPQGEVANLVMWYSAIALVTFFLVAPLKSTSRWVSNFLNYMPMIMLVPLTMMFVAIGIRVGEYGITVKRYFVIALGVWLALNCLYRMIVFWRKKQVADSVLVLSAVGVMILSLYGPWSAYPISIWHQNYLFEKTLTDLALWDGEKLSANEGLDLDSQERVSSFIQYFQSQHQISDITLLPDDFDPSMDMVSTFGFEYRGYYWTGINRTYFYLAPDATDGLVNLDQAKALYTINWYASDEGPGAKARENAGLSLNEGGEITLVLESDTVILPFGEALKGHLASIGLDLINVTLNQDQSQFSFEHEGARYHVLIRGVSGYQEPEDDITFDRIEIILIAY